MQAELILFVISVIPVIVIGMHIYKKDRNKEPITLLIKLFLGGIGSCLLVLGVSALLGLISPIFTTNITVLNPVQLFIRVFIGIALVEEACKWVMVYAISYNDFEFDELYDMIVYAVFVALGFAFLENLTYVYSYGVFTGITRALLAVPSHACDGVVMGYYLGLAKTQLIRGDKRKSVGYVILSMLVPTILHGIYDYCIFVDKPIFMIIFYIFVIAVYIWVFRKVGKTASIITKVKYRDKYCSNCGHKVDGNFCPVCGKKHE